MTINLLDYTNPNGYQNFHYTDVWGSGINSNFQTLLGKTSIGIDYRKELIFSTNLGYPLDHSKKIPGVDSIRYTKRDMRENISLYFEHNIYFNHFSASAGLMANHNTKLSGIGFYPGIDMSYQIKAPIKWYASFNRSLECLHLPIYIIKVHRTGAIHILNPNRPGQLKVALNSVIKALKEIYRTSIVGAPTLLTG